MAKSDDIFSLLNSAASPKGAKAVPTYQGGTVMPTIGGNQGASFQTMGLNVPTAVKGNQGELAKMQLQLVAESNEAAANTALNKLSVALEEQEKNFKGILGTNATAKDLDGNSLIDTTMKGAREAADDISQGLTGEQQRLYREGANKLMVRQYGSVSQHVFEQDMAIKREEPKATAARLTKEILANQFDGKLVKANLAEIKRQGTKAAKFAGLTPDQTKELEDAYVSSAIIAMVNDKLVHVADNPVESIGGAESLMKTYGHRMDPNKSADIRARIQAFRETYYPKAIGREIGDKLTPSPNTISKSYAGLVGGKLNGDLAMGAESVFRGLIVPEASQGNQLVGGKYATTNNTGEGADARIGKSMVRIADLESEGVVPKERLSEVRDNPAYNFTVGLEHFTNLVKEFGGSIDKSYAAYTYGVKAVRDAVAKAGDNWLDQLETTHKGSAEAIAMFVQKVSAYERTAFDTLTGAGGATSLDFTGRTATAGMTLPTKKQIRDAVAAQYPTLNKDSEEFDRIVKAAEERVSDNNKDYQQTQANLTSAAIDQIYSNGEVAPETLSGLDPARRWELEKIAQARREKNDAFCIRDCEERGAYYSQNLDVWRGLPKETVKALAAGMSLNTRSVLIHDWLQANTPSQAGDLYAMVDKRMVMGELPIGQGAYKTSSSGSSASAKGMDYTPNMEHIRTALINTVTDFDKLDAKTKGQMTLAASTAVANACGWGKRKFANELEAVQFVTRIARNLTWESGDFKGKNIFEVAQNIESLPDAGRSDVLQLLGTVARNRTGNYSREASPDEIREVFLDLFINPNANVPLEGAFLDKDTVDYIKEEYMEGREESIRRGIYAPDLTPQEILKRYVKYRIEGKELLTETRKLKESIDWGVESAMDYGYMENQVIDDAASLRAIFGE